MRDVMHAAIDAGVTALSFTHDPVAVEEDRRVMVDGGEITVRVYRPESDGNAIPCHLYFHGGGFFLGTLDQADSQCRAIAADAGCAVVSVDYRLAPEHKFPIAAEDCYAALLWTVDHAEELGVDATRISVGGASAGGNLAAVVSLIARDRNGPPLVLQVLEIPVTDFTNAEPLVIEGEDITIGGIKSYRDLCLEDEDDWAHPYASPLLASDLRDLPPALVMTAEYDALRPEGMAYAERLADAGVAGEARCWEGQFHGSQAMSALIPNEAAAYHAQRVAALRRAYRSI